MFGKRKYTSVCSQQEDFFNELLKSLKVTSAPTHPIIACVITTGIKFHWHSVVSYRYTAATLFLKTGYPAPPNSSPERNEDYRQQFKSKMGEYVRVWRDTEKAAEWTATTATWPKGKLTGRKINMRWAGLVISTDWTFIIKVTRNIHNQINRHRSSPSLSFFKG